MSNGLRVTVKPLMFIEECRNGIFEYKGERLFDEEIVKLINAQYEEIQQSKELIKKYHNENTDLIKENEQLKKEMGDLGTAHAEEINKIENEFDEEILKLEKENEQLKQRIKVLEDTIDGLTGTIAHFDLDEVIE